MGVVSYRVDDQDRIVQVNPAWNEFAARNGGECVQGAAVLGCWLFDFISDNTVRSIYSAILQRARRGRPVSFRFRCDAPEWRREFQMTVRATSPSEVEFASTVISETPRAPIPVFSLPRGTGTPMVRLCSWCHAVSDQGRWTPLEEAIAASPLLEQGAHAGVTHGICPPCAGQMFSYLGLSEPEENAADSG